MVLKTDNKLVDIDQSRLRASVLAHTAQAKQKELEEQLAPSSEQEALFSPFREDLRETLGSLISSDEFIIGKELGEGSFGKVFLATWERRGFDKMKCAVKMLHSDKIRSKASLKAFVSECKILNRISSPHLVAFYGVSWGVNHFPQIILEAVLNGSIETLLHGESEETSLLCWSDPFIKVATDICSGLVCLHDDLDIVHRDMKPDNVRACVPWRRALFITKAHTERYSSPPHVYPSPRRRCCSRARSVRRSPTWGRQG